MRGYFGIGVYSPKTSTNVGTLWRSALEFGASFMFVVAPRCVPELTHEPAEYIQRVCSGADQPSNTVQAERHIPLYVYPTFKEFVNVLPTGARLVGVEQSDRSIPLERFAHPMQSVYLLGAEDGGLPSDIWEYCTGGLVAISTERCLNVAVAGSIVMYDRHRGRFCV